LSAPFSGLTVLEYADFIAGPYCGKLLADMGARVIKVEPPGHGDSARGYGPFPADVPDREKSGLFLYLGLNKQSVTLDPATATGRELFVKLASRAAVLLEDTTPGCMRELGLDYETLREVNPGLIYVSISAYGQDGPKAGWKAYHLNSFHSSGEGYTLPGGASYSQFPDRGPVVAAAHLGEYDAGLFAASGTVAALFAREMWGTGQHVDVSKQEATFGLNRLMFAQAQEEVMDRSRSYVYGGIYPCKDGYVMIYPREDRQWKAITEIMGQPGLAEDRRFITRTDRIEHGDEVNLLIAQWASGLTKEKIYYQVAPSGCPAAFFATTEDLYNSAQLEAREFFREISHPQAGRLKYPTRPYRLSNDGCKESLPAPLLGQHNEEVYCGDLGLSPHELAGLRLGGVI